MRGTMRARAAKGDASMKGKAILGLSILALSLAGIGNAQTLKFETVDIPGSQQTVLAGLNNSNVKVGDYVDSTGVQHGMKIQGSTVTNIDDPNGVGTTVCEGINDAGVIVGFYLNSSGAPVGFVYKNGAFADILPFGSSSSVVDTVNDNGAYAGIYLDPTTGVENGFYGPSDNFVSVSVPGSTATDSVVSNNAGVLVITWTDSSANFEVSAFNARKQIFTTINVPGATSSFGDFINNRNQIAYAWQDSSGNFHGAVGSLGGKFTTFDDSDGTETSPSAINDVGLIDGLFLPTGDTLPQGFLAKK
jgi:hypothetical protein